MFEILPEELIVLATLDGPVAEVARSVPELVLVAAELPDDIPIV